MPKPRDRQSLLDILANIHLVQEFVTGASLLQLYDDMGLQYKVIHTLEIIGEAARRLSPSARAALPQVRCESWIAFRNRLSHV